MGVNHSQIPNPRSSAKTLKATVFPHPAGPEINKTEGVFERRQLVSQFAISFCFCLLSASSEATFGSHDLINFDRLKDFVELSSQSLSSQNSTMVSSGCFSPFSTMSTAMSKKMSSSSSSWWLICLFSGFFDLAGASSNDGTHHPEFALRLCGKFKLFKCHKVARLLCLHYGEWNITSYKGNYKIVC